MALPVVILNKVSANAGTVPASATGVAAIIAPCSGGGTANTNVATSWNSMLLVQQTFIAGPLVEFAAYELDEASLPVVLVKPTITSAATCSAITSVKTGTFSPSVTTATAADDYNSVATATPLPSPLPNAIANTVAGVLFYVVAGGALGTPGITYVYSLDGGNTVSSLQSLGTALTFSPNEFVTNASTGVTVTLGTSTQTLVAGDYFWFTSVGPRMGSADLTAALAALYASKLNWGLLLVHGETSSALISQLQAWALTMNTTGRYPSILVNTRFKNQIPGSVETETAYATAITTVLTNAVGLDVVAGVDGGAEVSPLSGMVKAMPTSLYVLARAESNPVGTDPAQVSLGSLGNCNIDGPSNTPAFHDENATNTLDTAGSTLRATTLRSFFGQPGAFVTNAYLLSNPGSDFVYLQDDRVANAAATIIFRQLTLLLSQGVPRNLKTGTILEPTARQWETLINTTVLTALAGQVSGFVFTVSRTDVFTGNGPQTIHYTMNIDGLVYVKEFSGSEQFVSTLP